MTVKDTQTQVCTPKQTCTSYFPQTNTHTHTHKKMWRQCGLSGRPTAQTAPWAPMWPGEFPDSRTGGLDSSTSCPSPLLTRPSFPPPRPHLQPHPPPLTVQDSNPQKGPAGWEVMDRPSLVWTLVLSWPTSWTGSSLWHKGNRSGSRVAVVILKMLTFVSVRRCDASALWFHLSVKERLWGLSSASDSVYVSIGSAPVFVCWATVGTTARTLSFYLFNLKCQMRHILRAPRLVYRRANAKAFVIDEIDSVRCYISDWRTLNEHAFTSFSPVKVQIKCQKLKFSFCS